MHLTLKGANKFAESLGLISGDIGVCSFKPQQWYCYEHKSIENEGDFDIEHAFWHNAWKKVNKGTHHRSGAPQDVRHGPTTRRQHSAQPGHQMGQAQQRPSQLGNWAPAMLPAYHLTVSAPSRNSSATPWHMATSLSMAEQCCHLVATHMAS